MNKPQSWHILQNTQPVGRIPSKEEVEKAKLRLSEMGERKSGLHVEDNMQRQYLKDVIASAPFFCQAQESALPKCVVQCDICLRAQEKLER